MAGREPRRPADAGARRRPRGVRAQPRHDGRRLPGRALRPARQGVQVDGAGAAPGRRRPPRLHLRHHPRDRGHGRGRPRRRPAAGQRGASTPAASARSSTPARRGSPSPSTRDETIDAAAAGGVREVLIDVNVGLPRCGCRPTTRAGSPTWPGPGASRCAASWATRATSSGSTTGPSEAAKTEPAMEQLLGRARGRRRRGRLRRRHRHVRHQHVGHRDPGRLLRADGHRLRRARPAVPPGARASLATVISVNPTGWAVADCGLKALGMDHGNPTIDGGRGVVLLRRAHHVRPPTGRRARRSATASRVWPAHVDPTVACTSACTSSRTTRSSTPGPVDLRRLVSSARWSMSSTMRSRRKSTSGTIATADETEVEGAEVALHGDVEPLAVDHRRHRVVVLQLGARGVEGLARTGHVGDHQVGR